MKDPAVDHLRLSYLRITKNALLTLKGTTSPLRPFSWDPPLWV